MSYPKLHVHYWVPGPDAEEPAHEIDLVLGDIHSEYTQFFWPQGTPPIGGHILEIRISHEDLAQVTAEVNQAEGKPFMKPDNQIRNIASYIEDYITQASEAEDNPLSPEQISRLRDLIAFVQHTNADATLPRVMVLTPEQNTTLQAAVHFYREHRSHTNELEIIDQILFKWDFAAEEYGE